MHGGSDIARKLDASQLDRFEDGLERIAKVIQVSSPLTLSSECHQPCQTGRLPANPVSRVLFTLSPECQIPCQSRSTPVVSTGWRNS